MTHNTKEECSDFTHHEKCSGVHRGAYCYRLDDIRGAIVGMTSAMLDNPDDVGIYPTTKFFDRMEKYITSQRHQERESLLKDMRQKMYHWSGTGVAMVDDYEKLTKE